jgi:hypothetical protein
MRAPKERKETESSLEISPAAELGTKISLQNLQICSTSGREGTSLLAAPHLGAYLYSETEGSGISMDWYRGFPFELEVGTGGSLLAWLSGGESMSFFSLLPITLS